MADPWSEGRTGYAEGGRITRRASGLSRRRTVRRVASSPATNATGRTAAWATGRAAAGEPESGPALQPGDRDGGGETEGQRQGQAGRLEPGRQQAGSIPGGRGAGGALGRRRGGGAQLGLLEGGGNRQEPPPADRPDDDEGPADHGVLRDRAAARLPEVVPRVVGDEPVVSHDPQPAGLDHDVEPDLGGGVAGVQVCLLGERDAVDRD